MKVKELKNYGKSNSELLLSSSKEQKKEINNISFKIMRDSLGFFKTLRLMISGFFESQKMRGMDLTPIRDKGFSNDILIKEQVRNAGMYTALSKMVGKEIALEILYKVVDATAPILYRSFSSAPEDLLKFDNPLQAFKD